MAQVDIIIKGSESGVNSTLKSVSQGLKDVDDAARSTSEKLSNLGSHSSSAKSGLDEVGNASDGLLGKLKSASGAVLEMGLNLAKLGAGAAVDFVKSSMTAYNDFEAKLKEVEAVSDHWSKSEGDRLKALAIQLGKDLPISATDAADSFVELAKAGFETTDITEAMGKSLAQLATAGGLEMPKATAIMGGALRGFGLEAKDSQMAVDVLAAAANASSIDITDMGETLKYVGPVAHAAGMNLQDVSVMTGIMGNSMIKGSMAGTSLRSIITRLIDPPKDAAAALEKMGFSIKNADGSIKPLGQTVAELREKFSHLNDAQQVEFATAIAGKPAMAGLLSLIKASPEDFNKMTDAIYNSDGAAQKMSDTMMNSGKGSIEQLSGSIETLQIAFADKFKDAIGTVIKILTDLVNAAIPVAETIGVMLGEGIDLAVKGFGLLVDFVKDAVAEFNKLSGGAASVGNSFLNVLNPAISAAQNVFNEVVKVVGEVASLIVSTISSNWSSISQVMSDVWNTVLAEISAVLTTIYEVISGVLGGVSLFLQQHGTEVQAFFTQAWSGIASIIETILGGIRDFIIPVIQFIGDFIQQHQQQIADIIAIGWQIISTIVLTAIQLIQGIITTIFTAIHDFLNQHGEEIKTIAKAAWDFISSSISTIIAGIRDIVTNVSNAIKQFWSDHGEQIKTIAKSAWDFINSSITTIINTIRDTITNISNGIKQFWNDHGEQIKTIAKGAWDFISTTITGIINTIKGIITDVANAIKQLWQEHGDQIKQIAQTAWDAIKSAVSAAVDFLKSTIGAAVEFIANQWKEHGDQILNTAKTAWNNIQDIIKSVIDQIKDTIGTFIDLITGKWDNLGNDLKKVWDDVWNGIVGGIGKFTGDILSSVGNLITDIVGKFTNQDWVSIGKNIIQGLIDGVGSMGGALIGACQRIIGNALDAIKGALGIRSPSKVMEEEVGYQIAAGAAQGVIKGGGLLQDAATGMAAGAISGATGVVNNSSAANSYDQRQITQYYSVNAEYQYQPRDNVVQDLKMLQMLNSKT